jgi:hypothetical protein
MVNNSAETRLSEMINLESLWNLMQDNSAAPPKVQAKACSVLIELMINLNLSNTQEYLEKAIGNLLEGKSDIKCIKIIEEILKHVNRRSVPSILK